tara:strand:- start:1795 stop:2226 length:432 start_codon:yes stop_codon:yes gene_type:complete
MVSGTVNHSSLIRGVVMKSIPMQAKQELMNAEQSVAPKANPKQLLRESVQQAMCDYFTHLEDTPASEVYQMVLNEVEPPLLKSVLQYTDFNRLQAAKILGMSRTTFHKKLRLHHIDRWIKEQKVLRERRKQALATALKQAPPE